MKRCSLVASCCTALALVAARPASVAAQTPPEGPSGMSAVEEARARTHFERGLALLNMQDYQGALAEFQAAYEISHRPSVLFNLGVTYQAMHRYPESARAFEAYLHEGSLPADRRAQVEQALEQLRGFIAHVTVSGLPAGATLRMDGEQVGTTPLATPVAVATGRHQLEASAQGFATASETFMIASGQEREVHFALQPVESGGAAASTTRLVVQCTAPEATYQIDGQTAAPGANPVEPGRHRVRVQARGFNPWEGSVEVASGAVRAVNVRLVSAGRLSPWPFVIATGVTVLGVVGTTAFGLATRATGAEFDTLAQSDPNVREVADRGVFQRTMTNVLLGVTLVSAVTAVVLLPFTNFGSANAAVDLAFAPNFQGGAEAGLRLRF